MEKQARALRRAVQHADGIVVPTTAVAEDLAERADVGSRVRVVHPAPSSWLHVPEDEDVVARRLALPAEYVLAITAPRTRSLDEALAEQDLLVVVTADPGGPLAQLVTSGPPPVKLLTVRPLPRGPRRALARAGLRAPRRLIREITR